MPRKVISKMQAFSQRIHVRISARRALSCWEVEGLGQYRIQLIQLRVRGVVLRKSRADGDGCVGSHLDAAAGSRV